MRALPPRPTTNVLANQMEEENNIISNSRFCFPKKRFFKINWVQLNLSKFGCFRSWAFHFYIQSDNNCIECAERQRDPQHCKNSQGNWKCFQVCLILCLQSNTVDGNLFGSLLSKCLKHIKEVCKWKTKYYSFSILSIMSQFPPWLGSNVVPLRVHLWTFLVDKMTECDFYPWLKSVSSGNLQHLSLWIPFNCGGARGSSAQPYVNAAGGI